MIFEPNSLFYWMVDVYTKNKTPNSKITIYNEGSSRSSKTWDFFHFLYAFLDNNRYLKKPLQVFVIRRTLKNSRERAYSDFKDCLTHMEVFDSNNVRAEHTSPVYNLFGNEIKFIGLDDGAEAKGSDIIFCNEILEVESEELIRGWLIRCRLLFVADWNPKYTMHWVFEHEKRPNAYFSKTTYKNNKHLQQEIISGIESMSPWHLEDLHLPEEQRRKHEENFKNGTVSEWNFKVYGMGIRANRNGLVYQNVTWVDEMPTEYDFEGFAMDLGFTTSPTSLSRIVSVNRKLYCECLIYEPTKDPIILYDLIKTLGLENKNIWCDSAHPVFIASLNQMGLNIFAIKKTPVVDGIAIVNQFDLHLVKNVDVKAEQENYSYRIINGITTDEPIKGHDHWWDAVRYNVLANFRNINPI